MDLSHDKDGFLVGKPIKLDRSISDRAQEIWRSIKGDTAAIRSSLTKQAAQASQKANAVSPARRSAASGPTPAQIERIAAGVVKSSDRQARAATPRSRDPLTGRYTKSEQTGRKAAISAAIAATSGRGPATPGRDDRGRFNSGGNSGHEAGATAGIGRSAEMLGTAADKFARVVENTEQLDPAIAAANEVKNVVAPIAGTIGTATKGIWGFFRRNKGDDEKSVPWLKRILRAVSGKRGEAAGGDNGTGFLQMLMPVILGVLGTFGAAFAGFKAGQFINDIINGIVEKLTGKKGESLGGWLHDKLNPAGAALNKSPVESVSTGNKNADAGWLQNGGAIVGAAKQVGVDPATMAKLSRLESAGFNAKADTQLKALLAGKKGSSASGLFQFLDGTWAETVAKYGAKHESTESLVGMAKDYLADKRSTLEKRKDLSYGALFAMKNDSAAASVMGAEFTRDNIEKLRAAGFSNPTAEQIYSMHMTGSTRAALANKKDSTADYRKAFSPDEIANNPMFFKGAKTVGDVFANMRAELAKGDPYAVAAGNMARIAPGQVSSGTIGAARPAVSAMPSARSMPSAAPSSDAMTPPPTPAAPPSRLGSNGADSSNVTVNIPREIGQNVSDRGIAQVTTGGLGGYSTPR